MKKLIFKAIIDHYVVLIKLEATPIMKLPRSCTSIAWIQLPPRPPPAPQLLPPPPQTAPEAFLSSHPNLSFNFDAT